MRRGLLCTKQFAQTSGKATIKCKLQGRAKGLLAEARLPRQKRSKAVLPVYSARSVIIHALPSPPMTTRPDSKFLSFLNDIAQKIQALQVQGLILEDQAPAILNSVTELSSQALAFHDQLATALQAKIDADIAAKQAAAEAKAQALAEKEAAKQAAAEAKAQALAEKEAAKQAAAEAKAQALAEKEAA